MKKSILISIFTLIIVLFSNNTVSAQTIDRVELSKRIDRLIENYEYYGILAESFNAGQLSPQFIEQFKNLFNNNAMIYNDVRQSTSFEQKISLNDYIAILSEWYPTGLNVNLTLIELGENSKSTTSGYKYQVSVMISKSIGGFTKENKDYRESDLAMQMTVGYNENFENMKILQIRSENEVMQEEALASNRPRKDKSPKEASAKAKDKSEDVAVKPKKTKQPKVKTQIGTAMTRSENARKSIRWYFGLRGGVDYNTIMGKVDNTALNEAYIDSISGLSIASTIGWQLSGTVQHFFSEKLGIGIGLSYVKTPLKLQDGRITDTYDAIDSDNAAYIRTFRAINLSEKYINTTLNIPITFYYQGYSNSKRETMRWYVGLSIEPSVAIGHKNTFSGGFYSKNEYKSFLLSLEDLNPKNQAEQANMEKYYLYGRAETNELLDNAPITGPTQAKSSSLGLNGGLEVGIDWFPTRKSNWCISFSGGASMGLLNLFGGYSGGKDMLLKQRMAELIDDPYISDFSTPTGITNYTPISDGYEYRSMWQAMDKHKLLRIGGSIGFKYQIMTGERKKRQLVN